MLPTRCSQTPLLAEKAFSFSTPQTRIFGGTISARPSPACDRRATLDLKARAIPGAYCGSGDDGILILPPAGRFCCTPVPQNSRPSAPAAVISREANDLSGAEILGRSQDRPEELASRLDRSRRTRAGL